MSMKMFQSKLWNCLGKLYNFNSGFGLMKPFYWTLNFYSIFSSPDGQQLGAEHCEHSGDQTTGATTRADGRLPNHHQVRNYFLFKPENWKLAFQIKSVKLLSTLEKINTDRNRQFSIFVLRKNILSFTSWRMWFVKNTEEVKGVISL